MTNIVKANKSRFFASEEELEELRRIGREVNERAGIPFDPHPTMTVEELQERMRANGVRPEENVATRELMRMRYGEDWDKDCDEE